VALQIMPRFLDYAKKKADNALHTVILVATSGDTGKAALEGFRNAPGISIVVFYPHGGVSEIQRLQMATTDGANTHVAAVRGNFDDCQTGVKNIFSDERLRDELLRRGIELSSANSINWGRLCPQIVYYVAAYGDAVRRGKIRSGDLVDFCVPTGNFGNILAAYYAKAMGLPVGRLLCASNKNRVLADFFATGTYDRRREFFQTNSPSMDILISSNLERFLFAMTGGDAARVSGWYNRLSREGAFTIDETTRRAIGDSIVAGWIDEPEVLSTIASVHNTFGYVPDTHTAVGIALCERCRIPGRHTIIASTASPYKFSGDVLEALEHSHPADEFACIERLCAISGIPVHRAMQGLRERPVLHNRVIDIGQMLPTTSEIIAAIN
jgi:threonine synthase